MVTPQKVVREESIIICKDRLSADTGNLLVKIDCWNDNSSVNSLIWSFKKDGAMVCAVFM